MSGCPEHRGLKELKVLGHAFLLYGFIQLLKPSIKKELLTIIVIKKYSFVVKK